MPPRRSARVAAVVERESSALAPLPHALALYVFSLLPLDQRMRCAEVCRGWRAVLRDPGLWRRLDLSASGVSPNRVTDGLLHAATARAHGELVALDLTDCNRVTFYALLADLTANGGALRELRLGGIQGRYRSPTEPLSTDDLEELLRAAPSLAVCEADVKCGELALAHRLLHNEAPFAPLRVRTFTFIDYLELDEAAVMALAAELTFHAHLQGLQLIGARLNTAAALDAVVDAVLMRRLTSVTLKYCDFSPASTPALVRLIGGGALAELEISDPEPRLYAITALALGDALRASSTITAVLMRWARLWRDPAAATVLLGALTGHPSLRSLTIAHNAVDPADREEAGAALGALVAANAPALTELDVSWCGLGDAGLGPLFDVLPGNTHLRKLDCASNELSDAFVRERLLPAVRANASLRKLFMESESDAAREAVALVQRRADAE
jgi:hypothetical protein